MKHLNTVKTSKAQQKKERLKWKASLKNYVFKRDLKEEISSGRLLSSREALTPKAQSPLVFDLGITNRHLQKDLHSGSQGFSKSVIQPKHALKVIIKNLSSVLKHAGNQCRDAKIGVLWNLLDFVSSLAAVY